METQEIIKALPKLSIDDRLTIAEIALSSIQTKEEVITDRQLAQKLRMAASLAVADYSNDPELTIFTALDGENFLEES